MRLIWIAALLLAALLPVGPLLLCAIVFAVGLIAADTTSVLDRADDVAADVQSVALRALSLFRAPPVRALFA